MAGETKGKRCVSERYERKRLKWIYFRSLITLHPEVPLEPRYPQCVCVCVCERERERDGRTSWSVCTGVQEHLAHKNPPPIPPKGVRYMSIYQTSPPPLTTTHQPSNTPTTSGWHRYRGTSLIRNHAPLGPYSRTMPRALWWSLGGGRAFL